jgi:pimeloyl-ACP methyl ester carboxylesterase
MPDLILTDGRTLAWEEQGDPDGIPVVSMHGSPGSRLNRPPIHGRLAEAGVRQITFDRPGYGRSHPLPGRQVVDVAADLAELLDALAIDRAAVSGGSGGGPHSLAVATVLADRCSVVHCDVGVAPYEAMGERFTDGMDAQNVRRFRAALRGRDVCAAEFGSDLEEIAAQARNDPSNVFANMDLPASDRAVLRELGTSITAGFVEAARQGPWGFVDDFIAIATPWGFDPADASAPVIIEYGRTDVNVPASHGDWLAANVPHVEVRVHETGGHLKGSDERFNSLVEIAHYQPRHQIREDAS